MVLFAAENPVDVWRFGITEQHCPRWATFILPAIHTNSSAARVNAPPSSESDRLAPGNGDRLQSGIVTDSADEAPRCVTHAEAHVISEDTGHNTDTSSRRKR